MITNTPYDAIADALDNMKIFHDENAHYAHLLRRQVNNAMPLDYMAVSFIVEDVVKNLR